LPEDRKADGIFADLSVRENIIIALQAKHGLLKRLTQKEMEKYADEYIKLLNIKTASIETPIKSLSGGNQQKVILAREMDRSPSILLAFQPTRGLDIGAIEFVRNKIIEARSHGKAVLLISTDLDEIRALSDRIAVIYNGYFAGEVNYDVSLTEIGMLMAGVNKNRNEEAKGGETNA
jgi:simple sugar transport system ATP-binding protein